MKAELTQMKGVLDGLYSQYNRFDRIGQDPLQFVYRYSAREDQEIVGFLSAALALV